MATEADPFLRWRRAQADNARTLAAIAETCERIAAGQAALGRALAARLERLRDSAAEAAPADPATQRFRPPGFFC